MKTSLACCLSLTVGAGQLGGKSPARSSLHRGGVGARSRRLDFELLLARQITLSHVLLALEQALFCLQRPLLRALLP